MSELGTGGFCECELATEAVAFLFLNRKAPGASGPPSPFLKTEQFRMKQDQFPYQPAFACTKLDLFEGICP